MAAHRPQGRPRATSGFSRPISVPLPPLQGRPMTAPATSALALPSAEDLSWEQYAGRACVWCDKPLTTAARSVGTARGRMGAHVLDIEVYAGPCCPQEVQRS